MIEGFRWSIALTARVLVRTIMDGSTAVMQAIHFDDAKRLRRALLDAPRNQRCIWQLAGGSRQSIDFTTLLGFEEGR